jgi:hypothetical protein
MRPPPIYPQLPHFHNHGLAIPFHSISSEKIFLKSVFLLVYYQNPQVLKEMEHWKREREKVLKKEEGKRKAARVSTNKMVKSIFWEGQNISTNPFCMIPFSSPPSYHFKNPYQNHLRKFHSSFWTIL